MPVDPNDYRVRDGFGDWTRGLVFQWRWWQKIGSWDHDHCVFCGREFCDEPHESSDGKPSLTEGYAARGPVSAPKDKQRDGYHWVCRSCFDDLREYFAWSAR
jgi:hypothetical protein